MDQIPDGYMMDSRGRLVRVEQVREVDKARDSLVRELADEALALSSRLSAFHKRCMDDIKAFVALSVERYGVRFRGVKGNMTLTAYDGSVRIVFAVADRIEFDEGLQAAKSLIDDCLRRWSEQAAAELRVIVDDTFQVDKKGNVSTSKVLGLRRHNIDDADWLRAMEAISDAVQVVGTKEYIRVQIRDENGDYQSVNLDFANA